MLVRKPSGGQPVAGAPDRLQPARRLGVVPQFPAEIPDVHLNSALIGLADIGVLRVVISSDCADEFSA
jgi:hypothetical protein